MPWLPFSILTLTILSLFTTPTLSLSLQLHFPNPNSKPSLLGDAHFSATAAAVQLTNPTPSSSGIILPNTPLNFTPSTSFSTQLTFQLGNAVTIVLLPANLYQNFVTNRNSVTEFVTKVSCGGINSNRLLSIEFYPNACRISSSRGFAVSKRDLVREGVKLLSWIDYVAVSKSFEVRVSELGDPKPVEPMFSSWVDLEEVLKGEEVLLGLASCYDEHEEVKVTYVYEWSYEVKDVPKWVHSIPVNPYEHRTSVRVSKERGGGVSVFMVAAGCGALAGLVVLVVWLFVVDRKEGEGEGCVRVGGFEYEKIDVVEVKDLESATKK